MQKFKHLMAAALLAPLAAAAVTVDTSSIKNKARFGIEFPDNTSFYGNADMVVGVSRQTYTTGAVFVTEVVIDILGSPSQVRIYNARPVPNFAQAEGVVKNKLPESLKPYATAPDSVRRQLASTAEKLGDIASIPVIQKVFPATTSSKTLEFVSPSLDELEKFYKLFVNDFLGKKAADNAKKSEKKTEEQNSGLKGKLYKILPPENMKSLYDVFNTTK